MEMPIEFKAPDGTAILGTLESIPGACGVIWTAPEPDYEHDGNGTDVHWDGQTTVRFNGSTVFVDEDGGHWLGRHLIPEDADRLSPDIIEAMGRDYRTTRNLDRASAMVTLLEYEEQRERDVDGYVQLSTSTAVNMARLVARHCKFLADEAEARMRLIHLSYCDQSLAIGSRVRDRKIEQQFAGVGVILDMGDRTARVRWPNAIEANVALVELVSAGPSMEAAPADGDEA